MNTKRFLSNYVKAKDVKEPITLTVTAVEAETFKDDNGAERESLVLYAKEIEQGVVMSKAALSQAVEIFGSEETEEWTGRKIILFNDQNVTFKGKRVGGLRFREAS